uniref:Rhodanese domain-containing protein n=1 Tax=Trichuris muris TaxID=70415 RepID=A0A5S6QPT8_TRIMR
MSQTFIRIQRRNESLRRMSIHTLAKLILDQAEWMKKVMADVEAEKHKEVSMQQIPFKASDREGQAKNIRGEQENCSAAQVTSSSLLRLITGVGEVEETEKADQCISSDSHSNCLSACFHQYRELVRYVLVDVRSQSTFTSYRLKGAVNFPLSNLCCGFTSEPPEMLALRNEPDKYIICYDDDERLSRRVAMFLSERDYDNVYVLSGGLRNAYELYPHGMVAGTVPQNWHPHGGCSDTTTVVANKERSDSPSKDSSCNVCANLLKNCFLHKCQLKPAFTDKELEIIAKQLLENQKPKQAKTSVRVCAKCNPDRHQ